MSTKKTFLDEEEDDVINVMVDERMELGRPIEVKLGAVQTQTLGKCRVSTRLMNLRLTEISCDLHIKLEVEMGITESASTSPYKIE